MPTTADRQITVAVDTKHMLDQFNWSGGSELEVVAVAHRWLNGRVESKTLKNRHDIVDGVPDVSLFEYDDMTTSGQWLAQAWGFVDGNHQQSGLWARIRMMFFLQSLTPVTGTHKLVQASGAEDDSDITLKFDSWRLSIVL